jgi:hypothetical protein
MVSPYRKALSGNLIGKYDAPAGRDAASGKHMKRVLRESKGFGPQQNHLAISYIFLD